MNSVNLVRTILANLPASERAQLAREVKEGLATIDEMLKPKRSATYVELEVPSDLAEAAIELALSKMPPSTHYTLHVSNDDYQHAVDLLSDFPEEYSQEFAPKIELKQDAARGEWWVTNRLTNQSIGSFVG